jgi:hypothetical protein
MTRALVGGRANCVGASVAQGTSFRAFPLARELLQLPQ